MPKKTASSATVAYSYIRFSSKKQGKEGRDSLRRQTDLPQTVAARHGWKLSAATYQDLGVSGFTGKNVTAGRLGAFLEAIDNGKVTPGSVLIVEHLDRFTRLPLDEAEQLFKGILRKGVSVYSCMDGELYSKADLNDPGKCSRLAYGFHINHKQSADKSDRVKQAWKGKALLAQKGIAVSRRCPGWLRYNEEKKRFEPIKERVAIIEDVFRYACDGWGLPRIAKHLNKQRVPTIRTKHGNAAKRWNTSFIYRLLTGRTVLGEFVLNGKTYVGYYPAVIDEETYEEAQSALDVRKTHKFFGNKGAVNLFVGLLQDEHGNTMSRICKDSAQLVSQAARAGTQQHVALPYDLFEDAFLTCVAELKATDVYPVDRKSKSEQASLESQLQSVSLGIERLKQKVDRATDAGDLDTIDSLTEVLIGSQKKQKALAATLQALKKDADTESLSESQSLVAAYRAATGANKNEVRARLRNAIYRLVKRVVIVTAAVNYDRGFHAEVHFRSGSYRLIMAGRVWRPAISKQGSQTFAKSYPFDSKAGFVTPQTAEALRTGVEYILRAKRAMQDTGLDYEGLQAAIKEPA